MNSNEPFSQLIKPFVPAMLDIQFCLPLPFLGLPKGISRSKLSGSAKKNVLAPEERFFHNF